MDKKLIKNYIYNSINQLVVLLVPILTAPYLSRVLGPENLGVYGYISSVYSILTTIGLLGLNNYGTRQLAYVRDSASERVKVFSQLMALRVLLLLVTSIIYVIILVCSDYPLYFGIEYILVLAVFIDVSWVFIGMEDMKIVASRNALSKICQLAAIFLFVKGKEDLWIYILTYPVATLIPTLYLLFPVTRYVRFCPIKLSEIIKHFRPATQLYLPAVATVLLLQINKLLLKIYSSIESVAYYDQAEKIVSIPLTFITILSTVMMPRIAFEYSSNNLQSINKNINDILRLVLLLTFPMCVGLYLVSDNLIPWFLGEGFLPSIRIIQLMCPLILFNALTNISGAQYFVATNQTRIITIAYFSGCVLNLIGNIVLDSIYGAEGAVISLVLATAVCCIYQYYHLNNQLTLHITYLWKYIISSIIMGVVIYFLKRTLCFTPSIINTTILILSGVFIYALSLLIMGDELIKKILIFRKSNK